jgi:hypothetical protein
MTPDAAFVLTEQPIPLDIVPLEDDRTPEGMICLGTRIGGRLVARCVVPPEAADFVLARGLFDQPVPLALAAETADPGLQCRLFAVVLLNPEEFAEPEEDGTSPGRPACPLGERVGGGARRAAPGSRAPRAHVRFERDRKH